MTEFLDTLITNNKQYGYIFIKNVSRSNEIWNERRKIQFICKDVLYIAQHNARNLKD